MYVRLIQWDSRKALAVTHIVQKMLLLPAIQGQPLNCLVDGWDQPAPGWEWQNRDGERTENACSLSISSEI